MRLPKESLTNSKAACPHRTMGLLAWAFLGWPVLCDAQKFSATVNRDHIRIGETIEWKIELEPTGQYGLKGTKWCKVADSLPHFWVIGRKPIDTLSLSGMEHYRQVLTLISFDTGTHALPDIGLEAPGGKILRTGSPSITVVPLQLPPGKELNDIKDLEIPDEATGMEAWQRWSIGLASVLLAVFVGWTVYKKKKRIGDAPPVLENRSINHAGAALDNLVAYIERGETGLFYTKLSLVCKDFVSKAHRIPIEGKTSAEFLAVLSRTDVERNWLKAFAGLINRADYVRFAQEEVSPQDCLASLDQARSLLLKRPQAALDNENKERHVG